MITSEVNSDPISERYRKYVLKILYRENRFYVVHGADCSTKNYDDNLLTDKRGKIFFLKALIN